MTIDRMDARVDVTPGAASESPGLRSAGGPASPQPASPQGTQELLQVLRPLVVQIIDSELETRLKIAGLK